MAPKVGIDRFTGGPRQGVLFSEKAFWGGDLQLALEVEEWDTLGRKSPETRKALCLAIRDLCEGILPIGSGAGGRGNGFMRGCVPREVAEVLNDDAHEGKRAK